MFILKRNDIKDFPFSEAAHLNDSELETWASEHNLTNFNPWMLSQISNVFGQFRVRKNDDGLYDPRALMSDNFPKDNTWLIGIWRVVNRLKRSSLVKSQIHPEFSQYSALVPLILAGIKRYQGINYSSWAHDGLEIVVDKNLWEAMTYVPPVISTDRLLEIRATGLTTKSGVNAGQQKSAKSTWKLTGITNTELGDAPSLATTMLAQIWVAHPSIRNSYMVLDPTDWDRMPEPIIPVEVFHSAAPSKEVADLPW